MRRILVSLLVILALVFLFLVPAGLAQDFCQGNFDYDDNVDETDAVLFKKNFGRSQFSSLCPICPADPWCTYP